MANRWSSRAKIPTPEQVEHRRRRRKDRKANGVTLGRPGLLDHGSNGWARKEAREGERRAEREGPR